MIPSSKTQHKNVDRLLLEQCESIITQGLRELIKIERAFDIIEKQQLYQQEYSDFEHYCAEKWHVKKEFHSLCCFQETKFNPNYAIEL